MRNRHAGYRKKHRRGPENYHAAYMRVIGGDGFVGDRRIMAGARVALARDGVISSEGGIDIGLSYCPRLALKRRMKSSTVLKPETLSVAVKCRHRLEITAMLGRQEMAIHNNSI